MSDNTIFDIFPIMGNGGHLFIPFSPKWFYFLEVGPFSKKKKYVNAKKFLEKDNICYFFKFLRRSFPQLFVLSHRTQAFSKKESEKKCLKMKGLFES